MPHSEPDHQENKSITRQVSLALEEAKQFQQSLTFEDLKNGQWLIKLSRNIISVYDRQERSQWLSQEYNNLSAHEIADKLIARTSRYAAVAGALIGVVTTTSQLTLLSSGGMTAALFLGSTGTEIVYLSKIQLELLIDLSIVYELEFDPENREEMLVILGTSLNTPPLEFIGKGVQIAAESSTKTMLGLSANQSATQYLLQGLSLQTIQNSLFKFSVPVVSIAVAGSYNYITSQAIGKVIKSSLKRKYKIFMQLKEAGLRPQPYDLAFPAAVLYMAMVDGPLSLKEKRFYNMIYSYMLLHEQSWSPTELQALIMSEQMLLDAITKIESKQKRVSLVNTLLLMALCDGKLVELERQFLIKVSQRLQVLLTINLPNIIDTNQVIS